MKRGRIVGAKKKVGAPETKIAVFELDNNAEYRNYRKHTRVYKIMKFEWINLAQIACDTVASKSAKLNFVLKNEFSRKRHSCNAQI